MPPKFSAREAIQFSWNKVAADVWKFVGLSAVFFALQIFPVFLAKIPIIATLAKLASMILLYIYYMGITRIAIGVVDGKSFRVMDVFQTNMEVFLRYIGAVIIFTLIMISGFLLLIIPGLIWSYKYFFAPYLVIDKNMRVMDAIRESGKITQGQKMKMFALSLLIVGVNILGALCLIVGLLITLPMASVAFAYAYRKIIPASIQQ